MKSIVWDHLPCSDEASRQLAAALNLHPTVARLLCLRGLGDPDIAERFLSPSLDHLHDPFRLADMEKAVERIERAVAARERIAIGDRVLMQEFSVYSVIPPEGCAAILWRDANKKVEAATALKITAPDMVALGLVDGVIPEPPGGAHNDYDAATALVDQALSAALADLSALSVEQRLDARYEKFRRMGDVGFEDPAESKTRDPKMAPTGE